MSVNGAERRDYTDYPADSLPVAWLGNSDREPVNGAAEKRRAFLDFLGAQWHPARRLALLAALPEESQIFITTTHLSRMQAPLSPPHAVRGRREYSVSTGV